MTILHLNFGEVHTVATDSRRNRRQSHFVAAKKFYFLSKRMRAELEERWSTKEDTHARTLWQRESGTRAWLCSLRKSSILVVVVNFFFMICVPGRTAPAMCVCVCCEWNRYLCSSALRSTEWRKGGEWATAAAYSPCRCEMRGKRKTEKQSHFVPS